MTTYGPQALAVLALAQQQPALRRRLAPDLPYLYAEIPYAIHHEMACTLSDLLVRRLRLIHEDKSQGLAQAEAIAQMMAHELQWSSEECASQDEPEDNDRSRSLSRTIAVTPGETPHYSTTTQPRHPKSDPNYPHRCG